MDTLGALALATEPPTDQLMLRPPVGQRYGCFVDMSIKIQISLVPQQTSGSYLGIRLQPHKLLPACVG
ncbi:hypothetical protein SLEP1_g13044 [Rubroshorea leprosula]|uniref:Uncharacterized protein n=1 Tax=Rubroshorea leprosula TaxID=152421 RepID=A0AAV5IKJ3_9ROSI|nr:hypothetical protein SLEP1_g13044 [Rubroshorea leprosula]